MLHSKSKGKGSGAVSKSVVKSHVEIKSMVVNKYLNKKIYIFL